MSENNQGKRTSAEWAEICALWELGDTTLVELGEKFNMNPEYLCRKLKAAGVNKGAKAGQVISKVKDQLVEAASDAAAEEALKIAAKKKATKEDCYGWIESLQKLTMQKVVSSIKKQEPLSMIKGDIQTLEKAMTIIAVGRKERFDLLGLNGDEVDPNDLPELIIRELTADEIHSLQNQNFNEDDLDDFDLDDDIVDTAEGDE